MTNSSSIQSINYPDLEDFISGNLHDIPFMLFTPNYINDGQEVHIYKYDSDGKLRIYDCCADYMQGENIIRKLQNLLSPNLNSDSGADSDHSSFYYVYKCYANKSLIVKQTSETEIEFTFNGHHEKVIKDSWLDREQEDESSTIPTYPNTFPELCLIAKEP